MTKGQFEDVKFEIETESPPEKLLQWSRDHIGECDKDIKVYELREMIYERGDVVPHRTDDLYLLKFLRARNFNLESTYRLLVNYYEFKENNPELHEGVNPLELTFLGDDDIIQVMPYRDEDERRIMILKLGNWNTYDHSVEDIFKGTLTMLELGSLEPKSQILGGICIFDFKNIGFSHVWQITPSVAKRMLELMVTSFPFKVYAVHITFEAKAFDIIYKIFQPFLSDKMREKIFFHGEDMESLHSFIPPKYLPKRYGGIRPNYRYTRWIDSVRTSPEIVAELRSLGYVLPQEDLNTKYTTSSDEGTYSDSE